MQWLRRLPQGSADNVSDLPRDGRGNHVHPRPGKCDPQGLAVANEWARSIGIGRIGCGAQQLSLLQRLHAGMPIKREPGAAQSRIALRRPSKTWTGLARAYSQPTGSSWAIRMCHALVGQRGPQIRATADFNGKNDWAVGETHIAEIHERAFRSLV